MSSDLVKSTRQFTDDDLSDISSWDSLGALIAERELPTVDISDFGTGFEVLDKRDKDRLIDVEFAILDWRFNSGDYGDTFVSMMVLTRDGRKYVVNDGGTGIKQQMERLEKKLGGKAVVRCPKGLNKSEYTFIDTSGPEPVEKPATTYYLSLEKANK